MKDSINTSANNSTLAISPLLAQTRAVSDNYNTPPNQLFHTPVNPELHRHTVHEPSPLQKTPHKYKFTDQSSFNSSEITEEVSFLQPLSQAEKLRLWRHDALMQHHYETACFIGDKVLDLTGDPNDAFWLAQVHYSTGNYIRAHQLLSASNSQLSLSVSCRYLDALCLTKLARWDEALDVIGETNPFRNSTTSNVKNQDGGIKLESSMCYLRGIIYRNQNNFDSSKECFKEAVMIDVKCFEAFNELISNNYLTPTEEWEFLQSLDFDSLEDNSELIRNLYTTRLNKYVNIDKIEESEHVLDEEYGLGENNDLLISKANQLFVQCKFQQCVTLCEKVLQNDEFNFQALPIYVSALHELGGKNKLFLLAHKLADLYPKNCITWLTIGIYYLSVNKVADARRFFSKASFINPNFGRSWIGFAHTFAAEGEHEQAISAYSTATRLFPGTHLPYLFLGMQYLQINNLVLAEEYMRASYEICPYDPLLLNELGVVYFHGNDLKKSEWFFLKALNESKYLNSDSKSWVSINSNLGHVYRKMGKYNKALHNFEKVLRLNVKDVNIYAAIGLIYLKMSQPSKSIEVLHNALALSPNDPIANDLLKRALNQNSSENEKEPMKFQNDLTAISTPKQESLVQPIISTDDDEDSFFAKTSRILKLSKSTIDYRKSSPSVHDTSKSFMDSEISIHIDERSPVLLSSRSNPKEIAKKLIEGELSDDEMDIESE